jgi:hypothetical protein
MGTNEQVVLTQTTITLPFLDDQVPALCLEDGRPYIPVFAVCHALGIRADIHIRRWKHLVLWTTARKLPFQTVRRGRCLVWCLLISEVPFLYGLFDWKLVAPERRLQLERATEAQVQLSNLAYQEMQQHYRAMRQALFTFLSACADIDSLLERYTRVMLPALDADAAHTLAVLLDRGRSLFREATAHARKMVYEQGALPVVDAVKIDVDHNVVDTFSMPLLPIVPREDSVRFFALLEQVTSWMREEQAFWSEREG